MAMEIFCLCIVIISVYALKKAKAILRSVIIFNNNNIIFCLFYVGNFIDDTEE